MTSDTEPMWWIEPESIPESDLKLLIEASASVLSKSTADIDQTWESLKCPPTIMERLLAEELRQQGLVSTNDDAIALSISKLDDRALGQELIRTLASIPELREQIDSAYSARKRMMVVDPGTILAMSLLVLVLKLRRVKIGSKGAEITLDPINQHLIDFVRKFAGQ